MDIQLTNGEFKQVSEQCRMLTHLLTRFPSVTWNNTVSRFILDMKEFQRIKNKNSKPKKYSLRVMCLFFKPETNMNMNHMKSLNSFITMKSIWIIWNVYEEFEVSSQWRAYESYEMYMKSLKFHHNEEHMNNMKCIWRVWRVASQWRAYEVYEQFNHKTLYVLRKRVMPIVPHSMCTRYSQQASCLQLPQFLQFFLFMILHFVNNCSLFTRSPFGWADVTQYTIKCYFIFVISNILDLAFIVFCDETLHIYLTHCPSFS